MVTTTSPVDEAILSRLKTALKSFMSPSQLLKLEVQIDLSIVDRMVVQIGETYINIPVKTKIQKLSQAVWEML